MQAALNTLREERRRVAAARAQLRLDDALKADNLGHWRNLMDQMKAEMDGHARSITLLDRWIAAKARSAMSAPPFVPLGRMAAGVEVRP